MSLKKILSRLRKIELINYPIRLFIKKGHALFERLVYYWPVSGTVTAKYKDVVFKVYNQCDDAFVQYFYYNLPYHESSVLAIINAFAKRSRNILDIGANTGIDAIIVAKKNPQVTIFAFEPHLANATRLERNIALNRLDNIRIEKTALGEQEGLINFFVPDNGRITDVSSAVDGIGEKVYGKQITWKKVETRQTTLDAFYKKVGDIHFFKCDVEGYEMNVFRGAEVFFKEKKPAFVVEICLTETSVTFFNEFAHKYGYTIYFISEDGLVKLNLLHIIDWRGDFLFSGYDHPFTFVPFKDLEHFVDQAWNSYKLALIQQNHE